MDDSSKVIRSKYELVTPSGFCRMGVTDVPFYEIWKKVWFDKKAIEFVLTGRNQHNLLGQYKDQKNHSRVFDTDRNGLVDIITKAGIDNYLKDARSIKDHARRDYYIGIADMQELPEITEPMQMALDERFFKAQTIKITKTADGYIIDSYTDDKKEMLNALTDCMKMLLQEGA